MGNGLNSQLGDQLTALHELLRTNSKYRDTLRQLAVHMPPHLERAMLTDLARLMGLGRVLGAELSDCVRSWAEASAKNHQELARVLDDSRALNDKKGSPRIRER
jgi:hypothetical protein